MESKDHVEFEEDFYSVTVLSYLKYNQRKYMLSNSKQSLNLQNALIIALAQFVMLESMSWALMASGEFHTVFAHSDWVLYVKLPCSMALHLYLYPEVKKGMKIMKFANN